LVLAEEIARDRIRIAEGAQQRKLLAEPQPQFGNVSARLGKLLIALGRRLEQAGATPSLTPQQQS
jgi:hypothetical protein